MDVFLLFLLLHVTQAFEQPHGNPLLPLREQKFLSIVGGIPVDLQKIPYNVQIYNAGGLCGGVILSRKIVLTAAHCFDSNKFVLNDIIVLSSTRYIFDKKSKRHKVWALRIHEQYNATVPFENDIALIIIYRSFKYSNLVQKAYICNTQAWMERDEKFLVAGWGETEFGEGVNDQALRMVYMEYFPKDKCMAANNARFTAEMFCLYGEGVRDACRGDSGGGVFWKDMLVGIVSHGKGCAWKPSVFVNVVYMKPWIMKTVHQLYDIFCSYNPDYS